jgi:ATP-dependent DNA helicase RecQ
VFKGERRIELRRDQPQRAASVRRALERGSLPAEAEGLFEALRNERARLARLQGVPPYVVFHDTTLRAMATAKPRTFDDLAAMPGVGEAKLERYGTAFLNVITAHI